MTEDFAAVNAELEARGFSRWVFKLERIKALLDLLGNPERAFRSIHITGTNGKTTTARMIESLLRAHGLRTGRYTSPHLRSIVERVSIDGEYISEDDFVRVYREVAPLAKLADEKYDESLTYFDVTTALAFAAFADAPVDVGVIEVGLGGETDATNVLGAEVAVVTPIGLDHTEWLGDRIEDIADMKAGIIHKGATLVTAEQEPEALEPLLRRSAQVGATVMREGKDFGVTERYLAFGGQVLTLQGIGERYEEVFVPLHGGHQAQNAAIALAAVESLLGAGLDAEVVREGFAQVTSPGRMERVRTAPTVLLDVAHNPHGMAATVKAVSEEFGFERLVVVIGVVADKDVAGMLELLEPITDQLIVTRSTNPRAMAPAKLTRIAEDIMGEERVQSEPSLPEAIELAVQRAEDASGITLGASGVLITGSAYLVGEARTLLVRE
ncbi:bifunctional folylpolyglutamate synthase/dihydrofolate synthase [Phytomonospora endophytica]|uniref:Dihydrofolate synthase/folylpolyglutamate synthase n=1 Tax=Phytomonospora endophytica TaxID=714109 RepID=A0A841FJS5_9ACTN|nr:folylpolyglutamate synthase/dihydrofolate synthase family protein [Phytomonospora endophytica]MBB6032889.1 dihydrofolate synthase/folylpolyglutamate synthase [Phytomonospora endophytica]GIG65115.1 dihydrofolate synthase [Phytomonospora endophytica]